MISYEYVIIGSGPAGVSAARKLAGTSVCVIDVGKRCDHKVNLSSFFLNRKLGNISAILGPNWEMLANLSGKDLIHPKLRASSVRHIMSGTSFSVFDNVVGELTRGATSFAAGGMSNIWGGQLLRYTDADLKACGDWPIDVSSLERYYDELEQYIGISGQVDDMNDFLGGGNVLMPPVPIVPAAEFLLFKYGTNKYKNVKSKLVLGRSRLAVRTIKYGENDRHEFDGSDFFNPNVKGLYTALETLDDLCTSKAIDYLPGYELIRFNEKDEYVELELVNHNNNSIRVLRTRHLLLGCGTLQTGRLILQNMGGMNRTLPFLDHPPTLLPFFVPAKFGLSLPLRSYPIQLIATLAQSPRREMIGLYYPGAMLRSDLVGDIPLPIDAGLKILNMIMSGFLVAQIWETSKPSLKNYMKLNHSGEITINYSDRVQYSGFGELLSAFRQIGGYSLERFATASHPSWGFHYAGCLPMRLHPEEFQTHIDGRLWNSKRVRVIDGSVLPSLPGKNHSLTIMANAARISESLQQCGY